MSRAAVTAGRAVTIPVTSPTGCLIELPDPEAESPLTTQVTFAREASRILERHCVECHRAGEIGPFALEDFDEVIGWGDMLLEVIDQQRMPPGTATRPDWPLTSNCSFTIRACLPPPWFWRLATRLPRRCSGCSAGLPSPSRSQTSSAKSGSWCPRNPPPGWRGRLQAVAPRDLPRSAVACRSANPEGGGYVAGGGKFDRPPLPTSKRIGGISSTCCNTVPGRPFCRDFSQVEDARVLELLRDYGRPETKWERAAAAVGR